MAIGGKYAFTLVNDTKAYHWCINNGIYISPFCKENFSCVSLKSVMLSTPYDLEYHCACRFNAKKRNKKLTDFHKETISLYAGNNNGHPDWTRSVYTSFLLT